MKKETLVAVVLSFGVTIALIQPVARGQTSVNQCIDNCYGLACSGYPLGSSSRQNCQQQCVKSNCEKRTINGWGAIAYSRDDKISGWGYEQIDKATAENVAMRNCIKQGGSKCQVEATFYRTCGSLAADGNIVKSGTGSSKGDAQQRALSECAGAGGRNCEVQAWICSAPNTAGSGSSSSQRSTPIPPKAISWGAIAYSSGDMSAGYATGKSDRATAEREAMNICAQRGRSCAVQTAFNKQCGALAADGNFTGSATAADQRQANQTAIDACRKNGGNRCVLHISFCSF